MDIHEVLRRPLITEKGTHQASQSHDATASRPARGGSYSFEVHRRASKPMIRRAVEHIYGVKVLSIRTANHKGKRRRYRFKVGTTKAWKKAVVTLDADSHIDLF